MSLARWDPFREFSTMRRDLDRLLGGWDGGTRSQMESWTPSVDIAEDDKEIRIKVELPEVDKKDINVKIDRDTMTISGERKMEKEEKKENYTRIERSYGSFTRSFTLPDYVDREKIKAETKDGVLKLTLPKAKATKAETKQIAIS